MSEFHGAPDAAFIGRTPAQIGLPDYAFPTFLRTAEGEPFVVRDVPLVDATGHARRFDVVSRRLKAANPAARWLVLEVATEVAAVVERAASSESAAAASLRLTSAPPTCRPASPLRTTTRGSTSCCAAATSR